MGERKGVAAFVAGLLLLGAVVVGNSQGTRKAKPAAPGLKKAGATVAGTVVFCVTKFEEQVTLDPIVIYNNGQYSNPLPDEDADFIRQVEAKYLRKGQKHRVIFGGAEAGTVTVGDRQEFGLTTSATMQSSIKLNNEVNALATSSPTLGTKQNSRRSPTTEERAAMMKLMSDALKLKKVGASVIAKAQVNNITAIDLDGDGKAELIGSFALGQENLPAHGLFLIAEQQNGQYQSAVTWYFKGSEENSQQRRLIDVLDLDGDGVAEVFVKGSYYESTDFIIYKKVKGVWKSVYQGGAFGV